MLHDKVSYPENLMPDEFHEIEDIASRLKIGYEAAEYVMRLEVKLRRMEERLSVLWNDYRQR